MSKKKNIHVYFIISISSILVVILYLTLCPQLDICPFACSGTDSDQAVLLAGDLTQTSSPEESNSAGKDSPETKPENTAVGKSVPNSEIGITNEMPEAPKLAETDEGKENPIVQIAKRIVAIDLKRCIKCGLCAAVCPVGAIEMVDHQPVVDPEKCIACGTCVIKCPTKTISFTKITIKKPVESDSAAVADSSSKK